MASPIGWRNQTATSQIPRNHAAARSDRVVLAGDNANQNTGPKSTSSVSATPRP